MHNIAQINELALGSIVNAIIISLPYCYFSFAVSGIERVNIFLRVNLTLEPILSRFILFSYCIKIRVSSFLKLPRVVDCKPVIKFRGNYEMLNPKRSPPGLIRHGSTLCLSYLFRVVSDVKTSYGVDFLNTVPYYNHHQFHKLLSSK